MNAQAVRLPLAEYGKLALLIGSTLVAMTLWLERRLGGLETKHEVAATLIATLNDQVAELKGDDTRQLAASIRDLASAIRSTRSVP